MRLPDREYDVLDGRISLPGWRKLAIALCSMAGTMHERRAILSERVSSS